MYFYLRNRKGEALKHYQDEARELEYRAARTDDPKLQIWGKVAHAARVRADARVFAGATHYVAGKRWDHKEID